MEQETTNVDPVHAQKQQLEQLAMEAWGDKAWVSLYLTHFGHWGFFASHSDDCDDVSKQVSINHSDRDTLVAMAAAALTVAGAK